MDLNLKALMGVTYLIPIAITLRKIYAPNFDIPEAFMALIAKLEASHAPVHFPASPRSIVSYELHA